jgi:2-isopropylmalate synthase
MSASTPNPNAVWIFDTTLRDGEQSPGCSMNLSEKLTLARQLERLGVDVIEAGFPIASDGDFEAVHAIAEEVRGTIICGLSRTGREDVDRALQALEPAAKPRVHVFIATSDIHLEHKLRMTRDEVLQEVDRAVRRAREHVDDVEFSAEDATRTDWEYLSMVFDTAIAAGASTINVPDTVGYTMPEEYTRLMQYLSTSVPGVDKVRMSAHCHNDLGLGVANSLAAVFAGARQIECTVNGIGERAGNTAMEEVVMAIKTRPDMARGLETHVNTEEIYATSRLLSSIIGVSVQPNKAIVGQNAFAHEAGIHQHGVLQAAITYEIMTPQSIGRPSNELVLGKHSGRHAFRNRLAELGIDSEAIEFEESFKRFKDLADKKKVVYNEDIEAIVADAVTQTDDRFEFSQLTVLTGTFAVPNATVELLVDGEPRKATAGGVGPVDAVFKAVSELTDTKADLVRYQVNAITAGLDAQGEVSVTISEDGRKVIGHGAHYDVLVASAKAYVHALNKLEWHKQRHAVAEPKGI